MIVWIDIETTGLNPEKDAILELGCVVTDDALEELRRASWVTSAARGWSWHKMDPVVRDMHRRNGLWMESLDSDMTYQELSNNLIDFLQPHIGGWPPGFAGRPIVGGSTVSFDRAFMRANAGLYGVEIFFHHRSLDVSALNELALRAWPGLHAARPGADTPDSEKPHRALADLDLSIATARHYARGLAVKSTEDPYRFMANIEREILDPNSPINRPPMERSIPFPAFPEDEIDP